MTKVTPAGYMADEQIIGISKLIRLMHLFTKRFTVQKRLGRQNAGTLEAMLQPHSVGVYLDPSTSARRCVACARFSH